MNIVGLSDAPIPWPIAAKHGGKSLVLYGALIRAVQRESNQAVAHWWGVSGQTVTAWKKALGVPVTTEGTRKLRSAHFHEPWAREAQKKAWAKARDAGRREKIAAARRGKPRPAHIIEAVRHANLGKRLSAETRRKMSEAQKQQGAWPSAAGRPWTAEEDELLRKLRPAKAAKQTGRTLSAVINRRFKLGVPDGRRKAARQKRG